MPAALLAGSFGRRDPGEEAVLVALLRALPGWEPIVTSHDPAATEAAHGCAAVSLSSRVAVSRATARADATVLAGGILEGLGTPHERGATASLARIYGLVTATRALGKPAAMLGVGSGRLGSRRRRLIAKALVKRADLFVLRDGASADVLTDAGARPPFRVGADPAWTLFERAVPELGAVPAAARANGGAPAGGAERAESQPAVLLALDRDACDEALADRLADALGRLRAEGVAIRLQPWRAAHGADDDVRLAGVVAARVPGEVEVLEPPDGLSGARCAFERSDLVLALRRHSLIAAAAAGVTSLAVAREPGIADLARQLGQPSVEVDAPPAELAAAIVAALAHPPASRSSIQGQVSSAEEGFRLLRLLLSRGRSDDANDLTGLPLEPARGA